MCSDKEIEKILKDKKFWEPFIKELNEKILIELEATRKNEMFNHCDFQDFLDCVINKNSTVN